MTKELQVPISYIILQNVKYKEKKMILIALKDKKAEIYGPIMTEVNKPIAIRNFSEECSRKDSKLNKYPEDFTLYHFGNYEPETGNIIKFEKPEILAKAEDYVIKEEKKCVEK